MPPPTPLLAAIPTDATHSPAASYMPQVDITLSTRSVWSWGSTVWPVVGLIPRFASVAPIIARSRQVTMVEHWRRYTSSASSGEQSRISNSRSMWLMARLR